MANSCPNCREPFKIVELGEVVIPWNGNNLVYADGKDSVKRLHVGYGCKACGSYWLRPRGEVLKANKS